jgi:alpha-L-rhamnosidase
VPTDCPQRDERQGWTADTQVYSMAGLYNSDTRMFYEKFMRDMRDAQRSDGAFPHIAPYAWGVGHGAAAWADAGIILPWNVYLMTGDRQIIKDNWTAMERYMNFLSAQTDGSYKYNGGGTDYGDWVAYVNTDSRYCSVCYYALDAQLMAKMARVLSNSETDSYAQKAKKYDELFQNIKAEWQTRYAIASTGVPKISTQCAYLMALHYNLLRDETAVRRTVTALRSAISNNSYKLNTGFLGTAILNQTLTENGLNDEAYTLLLQRNDPSWLYSIDQGATTIWERWNSYTKATGYGPVSMNSFNHYAYGIIAEWMFRHMAGICPDEEQPGFKHFILRPNPDTRKTLRYQQKRITSVDADFWSVYGPIKAAWECDGSADLTYNVTIPANTTATLYMPVADGYELHESGQPVSECTDIEYLGIQDGKAVCRLGSGSYRFTVDNATGVNNIEHSSLNIEHSSLNIERSIYDIKGYLVPKSQLTNTLYIQGGKKWITN